MRSRLLVGAVALALLAGACGLGDKEAHADRIINAGKRLMAQDSAVAAVSVTVSVVPSKLELVLQEPPRIAAGELPPLGTVLRPKQNAASVEDVLRFVDDAIYERIAPKIVVPGNTAAALGVPSNFVPIVAAARKTAVIPPAAELPATTSTTVARSLRRTVQIVREWAAFDFAEIPDRDRTKHGGSLAINPVALLRLTTGVLTGSVKRRGATFEANVSRDKAERKLSEDEREVLDKMFTANAVTRRVFPAQFTLSPEGVLTSFRLTLRQQLSSKDRADFTILFVIGKASGEIADIKKPARRGTVTVSSLGQLVTTVSGA